MIRQGVSSLNQTKHITSQSTNPVQALENVEEKKAYIGILVWPLIFVTAKNISRNLHQWYLQWRNAGKIKYICENKIDCVWLMFHNQLKFFILPLSYNLRFYNTIEDTLKAFDDLKNKQKGVAFFWFIKVSIFWKCVQYTIHWHKTQM